MRPIRHVATQAIDDCNSLLAPFLPHAAQTVHEVFGGQDTISPMPRIEEVTDLDDANSQYPIMTGDYRLPTETDAGTIRPWASKKIAPGTPVGAPTPIFTKLDDSIVEDELARLAEQLGAPPVAVTGRKPPNRCPFRSPITTRTWMWQPRWSRTHSRPRSGSRQQTA